MTTALKKANGTDPKKMSDAMRGMVIDSPFGADGKLTMRAEDHTLVGYAIGWGALAAKEPYMANPVPGNWAQIFELEAAWKKEKGWG